MTGDVHSERLRLLVGLRRKLELDSGLGVEYLPLDRDGAARLNALIESARSPVEPAGAKRGAERRTERPALPDTPKTAPPFRPTSRPAAAPRPKDSKPWTGFSLVPFVEPPDRPERRAALADLEARALACVDCRLCEKRANVAWGEGDLEAKVMFVGEGPGRDEDEQGRPFVGRSGRLLTDIIEKGMRVERRAVYITNVVKCRPPGNRDPREDEIAACRRYLDKQIEVIAPRVLVAVGGVAGCALLGLPPKSPGLRGRWREYRGIPLRVIYHPSYLLRQRAHDDDRTEADRVTWEDVKEVMRAADAGGVK